MKDEFIQQMIKIIPLDMNDIKTLKDLFYTEHITAKTILLSEGEIATKIFFILKGCLRQYYIKDNGSEITSQFFFENQMVASFESAITQSPGRLYIESLEDSTISYISVTDFKKQIQNNSTLLDRYNSFIENRLIYYMKHYASFILDSPEERYKKLIKDNPALVSRIPQQYIASYLGITPVSLSRIRNRIKEQINKG